ncbi:hypothetical protein MNBD_ALPHA12-1408 [hydrothermal vent metagenome]|uniref:Uncharacterized protein n=1 Tax=hydrothermal vent metagenome TaxID=652676 RepID=A0A3B0TVB2_9ZZZZ
MDARGFCSHAEGLPEHDELNARDYMSCLTLSLRGSQFDKLTVRAHHEGLG